MKAAFCGLLLLPQKGVKPLELFKIMGTIALNNQEANSELDETGQKAENAHSKIAGAFSKIGGAAVAAGKVVATGLAAGATAIGAIAKSSLDSYAEYEQLVGGVETLFKDSGAKVMAYASKAYTSAGMSANAYMETVTSFSASLLQGLGGDTDKAADIANRAISDMSDNANKMGTDISMIQNAYQGFAKQNYTMLDNLKLGYGGTQSEMARLINESGVLGNTMKVTAETVNQVSFDKIIEAIGVVQDRMGITGTTAREASSTIQGSLAATKAAWQNLKTGFADDTQDLGMLVGNLVDSATTAVKNIVPRLAKILGGISAALPKIMPVIAAQLPVMLQALLPGLIAGAVALAMGLAGMLPDLVYLIFEELPYLLSEALYNSTNPIISGLGSLFLDVGELWREMLLPAIAGVGSAFGGILNAIKPIGAAFVALMPESMTAVSAIDVIRNACFLFEGILLAVTDKLNLVSQWIVEKTPQIIAVVNGLWEAVQFVWDTVGVPIFEAIMSVVGSTADIFAKKMPEIMTFVSQCFGDIQQLWTMHLKPCFDAIGAFIKNVLAPTFETVFNSLIARAVETAFNFITNMWNTVLKPVLTGIIDFLTGVFTGSWKQAWEGLLSIVKGIFNGVISGIETMVNSAIDALNRLIKSANKIAEKVGMKGKIPTIDNIDLPRLEEGGILEKGQIGLLEGKGAEAVVPLDQNRKWISALAKDMEAEGLVGGNRQQTQRIIELLEMLIDMLPDSMKDAFASMKMEFNKREVARMVKAVN